MERRVQSDVRVVARERSREEGEEISFEVEVEICAEQRKQCAGGVKEREKGGRDEGSRATVGQQSRRARAREKRGKDKRESAELVVDEARH